MKMKYILFIFLVVCLFLNSECRYKNKHKKNKLNNVPLVKFANGAAEILTNGTKVVEECILDYWKINQPTVEEGHHEWFKELNEQLLKLKEVYQNSIVEVCLKNPNSLRNWYYENMDPEATQATYAKNAQNLVVAPAPSATTSTSPTAATPATKFKRHKRKMFLEVSKKSKKTKDWFKVLSRDLPSTIDVVLKFKEVLFKILDGYIAQQYSQYVECIGKSVGTADKLNRQLMAFKSLARFMRKSKTISEFLNVYLLMICNWNEFSDLIETLNKAVNDIEELRRWENYGRAFAKLATTIATASIKDRRIKLK